MKRLCTKAEKELLNNNKEQMLTGIYRTAARSKYSHTIITLILSLFIMIAGVAWVVTAFNVTGSAVTLFALLFLGLSNLIISRILNALRVKRVAGKFLKQENLMLNGATLIEVEEGDHFSYIEDDFLDENGNPIIIDYPSCPSDITAADAGKRILIMYASDSNFQLVRLNEELRGLIPDTSAAYPLAEKPEQYTHVPHPNMLQIPKTEHKLSPREQEEFADWYVKSVQGASFKVMKICSIILLVCAAILCTVLHVTTEEYPLSKTLPICAAIIVGLAVLFWLLSRLGKVNIRRQAHFVAMEKVVFHSYAIEDRIVKIYVYEWNYGRARLCEYPAGNVSASTAYGSIIYKFTNANGDYTLLNMPKERVS